MNKNNNRRSNDFPELQIGYPERNDVKDPNDTKNPNNDMERLHVDLESFELSRINAQELTRKLKGHRSSGSNE